MSKKVPRKLKDEDSGPAKDSSDLKGHEFWKTIFATLLGTVIGGAIAIAGQYYTQERLFNFDRKQSLSNEFPKFYENLIECRNKFDGRLMSLVDYIDIRDWDAIDLEKIEILNSDFKEAYLNCENQVLGIWMFLSLLNINCEDDLKKMQDSLNNIFDQISNNLQSLHEYKLSNRLLIIDLIDSQRALNENWKQLLSNIFVETKRVGAAW